MTETHLRSAVKSASYRFFSTFVTAGVAWFITHQWKLALSIGVADTAVKLFVYYAHERLWHNLKFGRVNPPPEAMQGEGI